MSASPALLDEAIWPRPLPVMTGGGEEGLRRQLCGTRQALGVRAAHRRAEQLRGLGREASSYRCVFCQAWHVGPPLSMDVIEALARVIRGLER